MKNSISQNLPLFEFPKQFENSLPSGMKPFIPTKALSEEVRKRILTIQGSDKEYLYTEIMELYRNSNLLEIKKFENGSYLARIETFINEPFKLNKLEPIFILLHLTENLDIIKYTVCDNYKQKTDSVYSYHQNYGAKVFSTNNKKDLENMLKKCHVNASFQVDDRQRLAKYLWNLQITKISPRKFKITYTYHHRPWSFIKKNVNTQDVLNFLIELRTNGRTAAFSSIDWDYDSEHYTKGGSHPMGIRLRLINRKYWAILKGDSKLAKLIEDLDLDNTVSDFWIYPPHDSWDKMINNVVDIGLSRPENSLEQKMLLIYAASEGNERAKQLVGL